MGNIGLEYICSEQFDNPSPRDSFCFDIKRLKVFGGWKIIAVEYIGGHNVFDLGFIPDPNHEWEIE